MENILKLAKLFIFNITIILNKVADTSENINYVPYEIKVINNKRETVMTHNILINNVFVNRDGTTRVLTNSNILEKLLIEYIYGSDKSFKDKFSKTFDDKETDMLLENFPRFSRFKYIEHMKC